MNCRKCGARNAERGVSVDMKSRKTSGAKIEVNALRAETAAAVHGCAGSLGMVAPAGGGTVWWGEAADEPARADARATENANCATTRQP